MSNKSKPADIKPGKYNLEKDEFAPRNTKIRITTFIDGDIVNSLKDLAKSKGIKYQTALNSILRSYFENKPGRDKPLSEAMVRKIVREEIKKMG